MGSLSLMLSGFTGLRRRPLRKEARAEGNLGQVLIFQKAADAIGKGELFDDDETLDRLRKSHGAQLEKIDMALFASGLKAARVLNAGLDYEKRELTKKGDIAEAQKIVTFQKKVEEWTKAVHGQARQTIAERPTAMQRPKPQPRPPVREVKPTAPAARIVTVDATSEKGASIGKVRVGDTIEIQYVGGGWVQNRRDPLENPDVDSRKQLLIVEGNQDHATITRVPRGTKEKPFRHQAVTDGEIMLRMEDTYHGDNAGSVRYSVRVIPAAQRP